MAKEDETIADIIAEKRREAKEIRDNLSGDYWDRTESIETAEDIEDEADRLEAAEKRMKWTHKKELETRDAVIKTEVAGREAEREAHKREIDRLKRQVGNVAKLRDALSAALDMIFDLQNCHRSPIANSVYAVRRKIKDALAAPARICDVLGEEAMINIVKSEIGKHVPMATDHERKIAEMAATAALATAYATVSIKESEAAK